MFDPIRLQILLDVLARAPVTHAEQLIIQELIDQLMAMVTPAKKETPSPAAVGPSTGSGLHNGVDLVDVP